MGFLPPKKIIHKIKNKKMKRSDIPTPYLMIKANTNSEWDCCDFAIISLSEDWKKEQQKRIENIKPFSDDYMLLSMFNV